MRANRNEGTGNTVEHVDLGCKLKFEGIPSDAATDLQMYAHASKFPSGAHAHLTALKPQRAWMVPTYQKHSHNPSLSNSISNANMNGSIAASNTLSLSGFTLSGSISLEATVHQSVQSTLSRTSSFTLSTPPQAPLHCAIESLTLVLYSGAFPVTTPSIPLQSNCNSIDWSDTDAMAIHLHKIPFGQRVLEVVSRPSVVKSNATFPFKFNLSKYHPSTVVHQEPNAVSDRLPTHILSGTSNFLFIIMRYRTATQNEWRSYTQGCEISLQQFQFWNQERMMDSVYRIPYQVTEIKARIIMKKYVPINLENLAADSSMFPKHPTFTLEISDWDPRIRVIGAKCIWSEEVLHNTRRITSLLHDIPDSKRMNRLSDDESSWILHQLFNGAEETSKNSKSGKGNHDDGETGSRTREVFRQEVKIDPHFPHYTHSQYRQPAKPPFRHEFAIPIHVLRSETSNYKRSCNSDDSSNPSFLSTASSSSTIVGVKHSVRVILEFSPEPFEVVVPIEFHPEVPVPHIAHYGDPAIVGVDLNAIDVSPPSSLYSSASVLGPSMSEYGRSLSDQTNSAPPSHQNSSLQYYQQYQRKSPLRTGSPLSPSASLPNVVHHKPSSIRSLPTHPTVQPPFAPVPDQQPTQSRFKSLFSSGSLSRSTRRDSDASVATQDSNFNGVHSHLGSSKTGGGSGSIHTTSNSQSVLGSLRRGATGSSGTTAVNPPSPQPPPTSLPSPSAMNSSRAASPLPHGSSNVPGTAHKSTWGATLISNAASRFSLLSLNTLGSMGGGNNNDSTKPDDFVFVGTVNDGSKKKATDSNLLVGSPENDFFASVRPVASGDALRRVSGDVSAAYSRDAQSLKQGSIHLGNDTASIASDDLSFRTRSDRVHIGDVSSVASIMEGVDGSGSRVRSGLSFNSISAPVATVQSVPVGKYVVLIDNFCEVDPAFPGVSANEYLDCRRGEIVTVVDVGDFPGLLWCENGKTKKSGFIVDKKLNLARIH
ncbi:hypothetical protein HDU77_007658 [Chytriomyces hyalinus]|nr:hypothetical protein HDU77_007658 [Chytriomyces hyalinus]